MRPAMTFEMSRGHSTIGAFDYLLRTATKRAKGRVGDTDPQRRSWGAYSIVGFLSIGSIGLSTRDFSACYFTGNHRKSPHGIEYATTP